MTAFLGAVITAAITTAVMCLPVTLAALCWLYDRHQAKRRTVSAATDRRARLVREFDHAIADLRALHDSDDTAALDSIARWDTRRDLGAIEEWANGEGR